MSEQKEIKPLKAFTGKVFNYKRIVRNVPFFLFLAALAVFYIYTGHHADKTGRKINAAEKSVKELEYEYKVVKSQLIFRSKAGELMRAVQPMGLREPQQPPARLVD